MKNENYVQYMQMSSFIKNLYFVKENELFPTRGFILEHLEIFLIFF
jgi:hypothetical protein